MNERVKGRRIRVQSLELSTHESEEKLKTRGLRRTGFTSVCPVAQVGEKTLEETTPKAAVLSGNDT